MTEFVERAIQSGAEEGQTKFWTAFVVGRCQVGWMTFWLTSHNLTPCESLTAIQPELWGAQQRELTEECPVKMATGTAAERTSTMTTCCESTPKQAT